MLLIVGILMVYLTGAGILTRISRLWSWKELIAFSFLIGIAAETFFMLICDIIGFQFSAIVLFFASFAIVVACYDSLAAYWIEKRKDINLGNWSLTTLNYPAVLLLLIILVLFYIITEKNIFWPTTEHDAIGSFDKLGIVMALEGRIKISLFQYGLQGAGGIYPPLFHGSIAYLYLFGAEQPKWITTFFYISLLLGFYAFMKKQVSSIMALFFTLLLEMVPELYSHAALLLGNLPTTAYVGNASLALLVWLQTKEQRYFWLATILMALSLWIRNDTIGFAAASVLLVFLSSWKERNWKQFGIHLAAVAAPIVIWTLYLKFRIATTQGERFVDHFGFDGAKMSLMLNYLLSYFSWIQFGNMPPGIQLYGLGFMLPFLIILLNFRNWKKDKPQALLFLAVSFAIYFLVFYLIDEKKQEASISSLMESSFKRGMFCFIPLLMYYAGTSSLMQSLSARMENFRQGK
ncbi:MAG: hypothetical protein U0T73_02735 [Chitinophagales bacterium]